VKLDHNKVAPKQIQLILKCTFVRVCESL